MKYEMVCRSCGWEGEIECKHDARDHQSCPRGCPDELEVLVSSTNQTRFGFGFDPGLNMDDGKKVRTGRRRPATAKKVKAG